MNKQTFLHFFFKNFSHLYYNNILNLCECWPVCVASWAAGGWRSRHRCGAYCWPTGCRVQGLDVVSLQAFRRGASVAGVPGVASRALPVTLNDWSACATGDRCAQMCRASDVCKGADICKVCHKLTLFVKTCAGKCAEIRTDICRDVCRCVEPNV